MIWYDKYVQALSPRGFAEVFHSCKHSLFPSVFFESLINMRDTELFAGPGDLTHVSEPGLGPSGVVTIFFLIKIYVSL